MRSIVAEEVRALLEKHPVKYKQLLSQSCKNCIELIKSNFSHLQLKGKKFEIRDPILDPICNRCRRFKKLEATKKGKAISYMYE